MQLGDKKPSKFLHEIMVKNSSAQMPNSRIRTIFIRAMPFNILQILQGRPELSLIDISNLADRLILPTQTSAYTQKYFANSISSNSNNDLSSAIAGILNAVTALTTTVGQL